MSFPTTNWTLLAQATLRGDESGRAALARLCESYRRPVISYLTARGLDSHAVEDSAQDFFLKLINSKAWKQADRMKGKFRTYLLTILNYMMMHQWRHEHAQKRGGGIEAESLDTFQDEGREVALLDPRETEAYDHEWALTLVESAMSVVEREFADRGQELMFTTLRGFLPGAADTLSYEAAAVELGISYAATKAAVHRLRQRFREVVRAAVSRTVSAPHEVDEELRYLGTLLLEHQNHPQPAVENGKENCA